MNRAHDEIFISLGTLDAGLRFGIAAAEMSLRRLNVEGRHTARIAERLVRADAGAEPRRGGLASLAWGEATSRPRAPASSTACPAACAAWPAAGSPSCPNCLGAGPEMAVPSALRWRPLSSVRADSGAQALA